MALHLGAYVEHRCHALGVGLLQGPRRLLVDVAVRSPDDLPGRLQGLVEGLHLVVRAQPIQKARRLIQQAAVRFREGAGRRLLAQRHRKPR